MFSANIYKESLFNFNHLIFTSSYDYENITDLDEKQTLKMFCKKGVLINFVEFIAKHLSQSLFFNKVLEIAYKGGLVQFAYLRGRGLAREARSGVFEGGLIPPMHTMVYVCF